MTDFSEYSNINYVHTYVTTWLYMYVGMYITKITISLTRFPKYPPTYIYVIITDMSSVYAIEKSYYILVFHSI